jgi:indolepyruvate ferredoxin oxidoreductase alpha subunit
VEGSKSLGIISSGIAYMHAREAAPEASVLKLGLTYPLPIERIREFARSVEDCLVIEEGDPWLEESLAAAGIALRRRPEMYRFGELDVARVRKIIAGDTSAEPAPPRGKPPELCKGCPHRNVFDVLHRLDCIVAGDIGCYTLGVLPPFEAMDTCVCMGASIGVGLGLRHTLPPEDARRVVSVIGDSTFLHSGITGLVEMVYNPPPGGHVVLVLDNGTTAMTGLQEHPGTGRTILHEPTGRIVIEDIARALGIRHVHVLDPTRDPLELESLIAASLASGAPTVIVTRRPCLLSVGKIREYEKAAEAGGSCRHETNPEEGSAHVQ